MEKLNTCRCLNSTCTSGHVPRLVLVSHLAIRGFKGGFSLPYYDYSALLEELFPVQLFLERLLEATAVSEKAFMRLGWFTGIVGIGGSSNSADVICDLEKPASIRVCIAVIGNVFCEYII